MNRKQKIAIVVGATLIVLLALFPPYVNPEEGRPTTLYWIGDAPPTRSVQVEECYLWATVALAREGLLGPDSLPEWARLECDGPGAVRQSLPM